MWPRRAPNRNTHLFAALVEQQSKKKKKMSSTKEPWHKIEDRRATTLSPHVLKKRSNEENEWASEPHMSRPGPALAKWLS